MTRKSQEYTLIVRINTANLKIDWINPHLALTIDIMRMAQRLGVTPHERTNSGNVEETRFTCDGYRTACDFRNGVLHLAGSNKMVRRTTVRGCLTYGPGTRLTFN